MTLNDYTSTETTPAATTFTAPTTTSYHNKEIISIII